MFYDSLLAAFLLVFGNLLILWYDKNSLRGRVLYKFGGGL